MDIGRFCLHNAPCPALPAVSAYRHPPEGGTAPQEELTINGTIHDLKSPLNSIITLMGWLKQTMPDVETKEMVETSRTGVKRLISNIEALLMTARMDRRQLVLNKTRISMGEITEGVKRELDRLYQDKPHTLCIADNLPMDFRIEAHIAAQEVAKGLDAGGIAYLKKSFEIEELIAYIRRHAPGFHAAGILFGKFSLRTEDEMLLKDGEVVKRLTPFEFKILKLLVQNMNRTVTREQLERELWENRQAASEYSLNNYMAKLRKYLADDETISLEVVPKVGYMLSVS